LSFARFQKQKTARGISAGGFGLDSGLLRVVRAPDSTRQWQGSRKNRRKTAGSASSWRECSVNRPSAQVAGGSQTTPGLPPAAAEESGLGSIDVFNGDADGLCALQQLRLDEPADAELVTGMKRDVALLARVQAADGDRVTVLDVSVAANRGHLDRVLAAGARVRWFDHHYAGDVPAHPRLEVHIDTGRQTCTALLVDRFVGHRHAAWAVVGAYGDNLSGPAGALAGRLRLDARSRRVLQALGQSMNHNAYADTEADLLVHPAELYRAMRDHGDPLGFAGTSLAQRLDACRRGDLHRAAAARPAAQVPGAAVYLLDDAPWARRVRGAFGNRLVERDPGHAYAIGTPTARGSWTISVRTPAGAGSAATFCGQFPTGGGRAAAAGINDLPAEQLDDFIRRFQQTFGRHRRA
jgi:hypothetical protein